MSSRHRPRRVRSTVLPFLHWPLWDFVRLAETEPDPALRSALQRGRHSIRMLRYWWAVNAIRDEARRLGRAPVVVDVGCGRGWLKRLADRFVSAEWIGLDGRVDHPELPSAGYTGVHQCDFEKHLPVETGRADIVVSLHVFEHLHSPGRAMEEIRRVLRPGGVFLAGTPTMPAPLAVLRTAWHQFRHAIGRPGRNGHARSFSPGSWQRLLDEHGFRVEFMTGSHLYRASRSTVESWPWWIRLNQFLGGLVPSLGSEVYFMAVRLASARRRCARPGTWFWRYADWTIPAGAVAVALALMLSPGDLAARRDIEGWLAAHRDHDDFYVLCAQAEDHHELGLELPVVSGPTAGEVSDHFRPDSPHDVHVLIEHEDAAHWAGTHSEAPWNVVDSFDGARGRLLLLSMREPGTALRDLLAGGSEKSP